MTFEDWDLFREMRRIHDELGQLVVSPHRGIAHSHEEDSFWTPLIDIWEKDDALLLQVDLPGVPRASIKLHLDSDTLTLQGERASEVVGNNIRKERPSGAFSRSFRIGTPIDPNRASAVYQDGVLVITLPKTKTGGPHRIKIAVD